ncbi:MAG: hypothetical protein IME99_03065 [Proteobacteria bacterium]|nr:hypothetical protein [Pseudomonadota bacterium]
MQYPIKILEQVQRVDLEIGAIEGEGASVRSAIEVVEAALKSGEEALAALEAELESINNQRREITAHLEETNAKIAKATARIGEVKNDRELKALTREKSQGAKTSKNIEFELSGVQSRLDEKQTEADEKSGEVEEKKGELERLTSDLDAGKDSRESAVAEKSKQREELAADIPAGLLKKYETLRSNRGGRAVVLVKGEACQGCFIHVPPQLYVQLSRGEDELISCPHCHRILYVEDQPAPV